MFRAVEIRQTGYQWMNEWISYLSTQIQYTKTSKSRTVSTGQKGSESTYNCPIRYANEETHCAKTKHKKNYQTSSSCMRVKLRSDPTLTRSCMGGFRISHQRTVDAGLLHTCRLWWCSTITVRSCVGFAVPLNRKWRNRAAILEFVSIMTAHRGAVFLSQRVRTILTSPLIVPRRRFTRRTGGDGRVRHNEGVASVGPNDVGDL